MIMMNCRESGKEFYMKRFRLSVAATLAIVVSLGTAHSVSAQLPKSWTFETPRFSGEFRHIGGDVWAEYQNGKRLFTFHETSRGAGTVSMYDSSRGLRVTLDRMKAQISRDGRIELTYTGGWEWTEWVTRNGRIRFINSEGQKWVEYQDGRPFFAFEETDRYNGGRVDLYDARRGIRVELDEGEARVVVDGKVTLKYAGRFTQ
jgi:hypothetical protein